MEKYSKAELKARAFHRVAVVLHGHWEEGSGAHTRLFEILVPEEYVICGTSVNGDGHREHVVPCAYIRNHCIKMFQRQDRIEAVADFIGRHLKIALITPEEAHRLDFELKLKTDMPKGWNVGDDVMARFHEANIVIRPVVA